MKEEKGMWMDWDIGAFRCLHWVRWREFCTGYAGSEEGVGVSHVLKRLYSCVQSSRSGFTTIFRKHIQYSAKNVSYPVWLAGSCSKNPIVTRKIPGLSEPFGKLIVSQGSVVKVMTHTVTCSASMNRFVGSSLPASEAP